MTGKESLIEESFWALERRVSNTAEELLDKITVALGDYDTETLLAIAEYRNRIHPDGWMQRVIWQYVEVWRA